MSISPAHLSICYLLALIRPRLLTHFYACLKHTGARGVQGLDHGPHHGRVPQADSVLRPRRNHSLLRGGAGQEQHWGLGGAPRERTAKLCARGRVGTLLHVVLCGCIYMDGGTDERSRMSE